MSPATSPTIGLKTLAIRDFRGIGELDLDFRRPDGRPNRLIVLAGPNGCGKTSVLEAALMSVGGHSLVVGPQGRRAIRKGADGYRIRAVISRSHPGLQFEEDDLATEVDAHQPQPTPVSDVPFWYFSSWRAPSLVGAVDVSVGRRGRRPKKNDVNRLRNVKQLLTNAAAVRSFPTSRPSRAQDYERWIEQLDASWSLFHPGKGEGFLVDLADPDESEGGAFDVFLHRPGGPPIPVDDFSSGQLELFLFLAALVLNNGREGIVFIDEPELHLDPQWHAPILRALMQLQPRAQFIVATHSPTIFETAKSYERHFLVPDDDPRASIWREAAARS